MQLWQIHKEALEINALRALDFSSVFGMTKSDRKEALKHLQLRGQNSALYQKLRLCLRIDQSQLITLTSGSGS